MYEAYCFKCKSKQTVLEPELNGKHVKGKCKTCGAKISSFIKLAKKEEKCTCEEKSEQ